MYATACLFILGYMAAVLQSSAGALLQVGLVRLDALTALLCWYSLRRDALYGSVFVVVFGLLISSFSIIPAYVFPLSYLLGFLTVRYIVSNVLELSSWQVYLMTGFVSMEISVVQLAGSGSADLVWPWGVLQALVNVLTAPVLMAVFDRIEALLKKLRKEKGEIATR